jgi:hypothetical protein
LSRWREQGIPIVAMDDSDDGTYEILLSDPNVTAFRQEDVYGRNTEGSGDWMFQAILDKKRELFGASNYIFIALGDEYWYHSPRNIVYDMEIENATVCIVHSCQFFLHTSDKEKWDFDKQEWKAPYDKMKIWERQPWYTPGYIAERRIFWDDGKCFYAPKQGYNPMPHGVDWRQYSKNPIIMHFPIRNPKQIIERAKDRIERNYQPAYHHSYKKKQIETFRDFFPYSHEAFKFNGTFNEYEKGLEYLNEGIIE